MDYILEKVPSCLAFLTLILSFGECFFCRLSFIQFLIINFRRHIAGILKIKWYLSASPMIIYTMVLIVGQYGSFKQMLTKGQTLRMRA